MASRTVVCPECGAPVPYGRLSCPSCGALLASVAGALGRPVALRVIDVDGAAPTLVADAPAYTNGHGDPLPPVGTGADLDDAAEPLPPADPDVDPRALPEIAPPTGPAEEPEPADDAAAPVGAPGDLDDAAEPPPPEVEVPPEPAARGPEPPVPTGSEPAMAIPLVLDDWTPKATDRQPEWPRRAEERPTAIRVPSAPATWAPGPLPPPAYPPAQTPAGAWLPPSAAFAPPEVLAEARAEKAVKPGQAALLADLPFDAPNDLAGWLVTLGSGIAMLGFLLPWADAIPFTSGDFGYTARWGLAWSSHWIIFVAVVGLFALSIVPSRLPTWVRSGVLPLGLGGLALGAVWPFVVGVIGSDAGSVAVAVGALLLVVGGTLGVRPRHATQPASV